MVLYLCTDVLFSAFHDKFEQEISPVKFANHLQRMMMQFCVCSKPLASGSSAPCCRQLSAGREEIH